MTREQAQRIAAKACNELGEHFQNVQILVSYTEEGGTVSIQQGEGCWYSRVGMAREFLIQDDERVREHIRGEAE